MTKDKTQVKSSYRSLFLIVYILIGQFNLVQASTVDNQIIDNALQTEGNGHSKQSMINPPTIAIFENNSSDSNQLATPDKSSDEKNWDFDLSNHKTLITSHSKQNFSAALDGTLLEILGINLQKPSFMGYNNDLFHLDTNNLWINLNNSMCYRMTKVLSALAKGVCENNSARKIARQFDSQLAFMLSFLKRQ
ncbi:MAG: hypothetical protein V3U75_10160 [Methylococcaceae bacterium]